MPIPFRDVDEIEELGSAAFLKIEAGAGSGEYFGALFLVNARGEPLEFAYNRVETPADTFLWRRSDLRRHAERRLTASLLEVCGRAPRLLLGLAEEVGSELFCEDLQVELPVGRIGRPMQASAYSAREVEERLEGPEALHLFWFPGPPGDGSPERRLLERLRARGLLLEPFERAAEGLMEVFSARDEERP